MSKRKWEAENWEVMLGHKPEMLFSGIKWQDISSKEERMIVKTDFRVFNLPPSATPTKKKSDKFMFKNNQLVLLLFSLQVLKSQHQG